MTGTGWRGFPDTSGLLVTFVKATSHPCVELVHAGLGGQARVRQQLPAAAVGASCFSAACI
jgi:hypothetical protein